MRRGFSLDTNIIAVRHGETDWNSQGRIQGHLNSSLTAAGRAQARAVAQRLAGEPIAAIHCSDLGRAQETARPAAETLRLDIRSDARLRERKLGIFEGLTFLDAEARFPEQFVRYRGRDPHLELETGESLVMLRDRVAAAMADIGAEHDGGTVLVVTHGGVLDILYRLAADMTLDAPRTFSVENASVNRLRWDGRRLHLVSWGDVSHHGASPVGEF